MLMLREKLTNSPLIFGVEMLPMLRCRVCPRLLVDADPLRVMLPMAVTLSGVRVFERDASECCFW